MIKVAALMAFTLLVAAEAELVSVEFNNLNFASQMKQLKLEGDAFLQGNILHLTKEDGRENPEPNRAGRASYYKPITLWANKTAHFTSEFIFTFEPIDPFTFGDGLAFFIAPFHSSLPTLTNDGALGLVNFGFPEANSVVAVEFDRYVDGWDPQSGAHIGIDVNTVVSEITVKWDLGNEVEVAARAVIDYDPVKKELKLVVTDPAGLNESCRFSYGIDLRDFLPESLRVGFSASTGKAVERHKILFWNFTSYLKDEE